MRPPVVLPLPNLKTKMIKYFLILLSTLSVLSGCRSALPMVEQVPRVEYKPIQRVVVSVVDNRKLSDGYTKAYVGTTLQSFGIPITRNVSFLSTESGDDKNGLSKFLQDRIVTGFITSGWNTKAIQQIHIPSQQEAEVILSEHRAEKLIVLSLNEWDFWVNVAKPGGILAIDTFDFNANADVLIFTKGQSLPFAANFGGHHVVPVETVRTEQTKLKNYPNMIVIAYKNQLSQILNTPSVREQF